MRGKAQPTGAARPTYEAFSKGGRAAPCRAQQARLGNTGHTTAVTLACVRMRGRLQEPPEK